jgi:23S rRNA U2552 (ribose-2'-O)-methylase RlmE/FtsJ
MSIKFHLPPEYYPKRHIILLHNNEKEPDNSKIVFLISGNKFKIPLLEEEKKKSDTYQVSVIESHKQIIKSFKNNNLNDTEFYNYLTYDNFTKKRSGDREYDKIYNIDTIGVWSSAWKKMFEIVKTMDLIDTDKDKIRHFDICSFPCSFIFAINHYIKTETDITTYDWYSQSYIDLPNCDNGQRLHFKPGKGLFDHYPKNFLLGSKESSCNGDITNIKNIKNYLAYFKNDKLDFITSDCGISNSWKEGYSREIDMTNIYFSQLICSLGILKKGGNIVMKTYTQFEQFSFCNIYLMTLLFEKVYLVKPEASSHYGHEVYMVGKNYYDNLSEVQYQQLLDMIPIITREYYDKTYIPFNNVQNDVVKKLDEKVSKYYSHVFDIRMLRQKIFEEEIMSLIETPERIIPKIKSLNTATWQAMKIYYSNYMKKINMKKIDDEDKIINWKD